MDSTTGGTYRFHPYAMILPAVSEEDYGALKQSIREIGQTTAALVDEDGLIVDGKHRAQACEDLGIPLVTETLSGDADLWSVAVSSNALRRSLNKSQLAMIAARTVNAPTGSPPGGDYSVIVTRHKAAEVFGISKTYVASAKRLLDNADDASELIQAVENGEMRVILAEQTLRNKDIAAPKPPPKYRNSSRFRHYSMTKTAVKNITTIKQRMDGYFEGEELREAVVVADRALEAVESLQALLKQRK